MKKIITSLALLTFLNVQAQIPNGNFETLNATGNVSLWGKLFIQNAWLDSAGVSHGDSIVFDNQLYFATTDAHTGQYAVEMRNAFNYTDSFPIGGGVLLASSDFSAYGFPEIVTIPTTQANTLQFYCKYFPAIDDSAEVNAVFYDATGAEIGVAVVAIKGTISTYTQFNVPINFSVASPISAVSIYMNTFYNCNENFGTRLLVDDISLQTLAAIDEAIISDIEIAPNPVSEELKITGFEGEITQVKAINSLGETILLNQMSASEIDCGPLTNGLYTLIVQTQNKQYIKRLLKVD